jgi:hypothetical protein
VYNTACAVTLCFLLITHLACEAGMACAAIPCPSLHPSPSAFDPRCQLFPSLHAAVAAIDTPASSKYPEDLAQAATLKLLRSLLKIGIKDAADSQLATACQFVIGSLAAARSLTSNDKSRVCQWVKNVLYVRLEDEAGFVCSATSITRSGSNALLPGQMMNVAMTYSALSLLITCGDDLAEIDAAGVARFISRAQTESGAFASHKGHTEVDARFCFAAVASLYMLSHRAATPQNFFAAINVENLLNFFARCQSFDGGFSLFEGGEAHGGSTFCCVASMWLLQQNMFLQTSHPLPIPLFLAPSSPLLPPSIDIAMAQRWCCLRVRSFSRWVLLLSLLPLFDHILPRYPTASVAGQTSSPTRAPPLMNFFAFGSSALQMLHFLGRDFSSTARRAASCRFEDVAGFLLKLQGRSGVWIRQGLECG